jgi:hypothetical protein
VVATSYSFKGNEEGNNITIANFSKTPLLINHYELIWLKRKWGRTISSLEVCSEECNIDLLPHARKVLKFSGEDQFDTGYRTEAHGKLYIRLYLLGKRAPVTKLVYAHT